MTWWTSSSSVSTWPDLTLERCGGRAGPGVLFGHHHADGDGGSGRHQGGGTGQSPKTGVGALPGLGEVAGGVELIGHRSSDQHRSMEAALVSLSLKSSCALICELMPVEVGSDERRIGTRG